MQIVIDLKDFDATEAELDEIYSDSNYDDRFFIVDNQGDLHKVSLTWEQGRNNNYRFVKGDIFGYSSQDIIWPNNVTHIEVFNSEGAK